MRLAIVAALAAVILAGCSWPDRGTSAGLFPAPYVAVNKDAYAASVYVLPDATDPNAFAIQTRYRSKTGDLPDIAFSVEKPSPDVVVGTAKIRLGAGQQIEK